MVNRSLTLSLKIAEWWLRLVITLQLALFLPALKWKAKSQFVLHGLLIHHIYDTIFRLHQRTICNMFTVPQLIVAKRMKAVFKPKI